MLARIRCAATPTRSIAAVGKAEAARKVAAAAMYGGGGLSVVGASLFGVLKAEAKLARKAIRPAGGEPPNAPGRYGRGLGGQALKVARLATPCAPGSADTTVVDPPGAALTSRLPNTPQHLTPPPPSH